MSLTEEELLKIGRDTGKKVVIREDCKFRAAFVLDEIESATEHENLALEDTTEDNPEEARKSLLISVNGELDNLNDFYPDMPFKTMLLKDLGDIKTLIEKADLKDMHATAEKVVGAYHDLHEKLTDMMLEDFKQCECETPAVAERKKLPTRNQVYVDVWDERDRLVIKIVDKETEKVYASWEDDDARQMFEDGFFKRGIVHHQLSQSADRNLADSVFEYAEDMGILKK